MKNFFYGILAGLILFVGYNNKSAVANIGLNLLKGTGHAISNAFAPKIAQSQEIYQQQVVEKKAISKFSQKVANKVLPQANAAVIPAQEQVKAQPKPQMVASTNNNYMIPQKSVSPQVSQYKYKSRQNSRTSISLVTE